MRETVCVADVVHGHTFVFGVHVFSEIREPHLLPTPRLLRYLPPFESALPVLCISARRGATGINDQTTIRSVKIQKFLRRSFFQNGAKFGLEMRFSGAKTHLESRIKKKFTPHCICS